MEFHTGNYGFGLFDGLRNRGFWAYFTSVAIGVFVLLTIFDFVLQYIYGKDQSGASLSIVWDIGINIAVGLASAGIAWKYDGQPWINRPDTIKLDLDK